MKNIKFKVFICICIYMATPIKNSIAGDCTTKIYSSEKKWTPEYLFDDRKSIAWDIGSDYGIPFSKINYSSGIECIEFEEDTMCGIARDSFIDSHVSIKINGHENIVIGDGGSIETIVSDITRNNNMTRVFSAETGEMIAFEINVEGLGWTRFVTCDLAGAIYLRGLDEQQGEYLDGSDNQK